MTPLALKALTRPTFAPGVESALRRLWREEGAAQCPECRIPLVAEPVPQPRDVAYVRRRSWLTCPGCGRSVIADDPREAP